MATSGSNELALNVAQQWQLAERIEKQIMNAMKEKEGKAEDVEHLIQQLRLTCEIAIFLDIEFATNKKIEDHLWSAHTKINARYRKILARYTKEPQKKNNLVEKRKWEKRYVDFLKTSQFFYKGFVQRMASHYDIPELRRIANRLQLETLTVDGRVTLSSECEALALLSCHATLLRLGDLSRYRNVLRMKDRSWDVAFAYYALANDLCPSKGMAFNQMAVISTIDADHLQVIYHLYRALAIEEPVPMAPGNLGIQFKKILEEWTGSKKILSRRTPSASAASTTYPLILWFVRLHARLYKGEEFDLHNETENEVLSQLTLALKEKSLETVLDKFVLINIAAQDFAGERLRVTFSEETYRSYKFFLRLNVRMLFMLLQILQPELNFDYSRPDANGDASSNGPETITLVMRRVLPALRQYSTWLVTKVGIINSQSSEMSHQISIHIREMWSMYASTLNMLVSAFDVQNLPSVDYLLEEDGATVGFKPLRELQQWSNYLDGHGNLKPRTTDFDIARSHPNVEMLARIKDLLRDGMVLGTRIDACPINVLDGGSFQFVEEDLPLSPIPISQSTGQMAGSDTKSLFTWAERSSVNETTHGNAPPKLVSRPSSIHSESYQSMGTEMYNMVDELTTPIPTTRGGPSAQSPSIGRDTTYGMHSSTAYDVFGKDSQRPTSHQQSNTPLFVGGSPFAPRPGELPHIGSGAGDCTPTAMRLDSLQLRDENERLVAATSFRDHTDSCANQRSSPWGAVNDQNPSSGSLRSLSSRSRPPTGSQSFVASFLQQQLAGQYMPSSGFTNNSSIYGGTPSYVQGVGVVGQPGAVPRNILHNTSIQYDGLSAFEKDTLLQSSFYNGTQPVIPESFTDTPPGGQGD